MTSSPVRTLPRFVPETSVPQARRRRRPRRESSVLFLVFAAAYLIVTALLIQRNVVFTDATSRLSNAFFVLYSRYPHLPALGFVWNPLPSLVLLPLLPFKSLFPALVTAGVAGAIQSALCMAGTVATMASCLRKMGLGRGPRIVLAALFGLQPMILLYGGSGQSEPMLLLFLALAVSSLLSWVRRRQPGSLVAAGVSLGLGYLARYEAVAPAIAAVVLVMAVSFFAARGPAVDRVRVMVNDMLLVGGPALFAIVLWAASAKLLVGQWFPTFSSNYGNAAQVANASKAIQQATGTNFAATLEYLGKQMFVLAPACAILLVIAVVLAVKRRDLSALVAPFIFGSVLAFAVAVLLAGSSFGWLRFQISIIPLTVLLAGTVLAPARPRVERSAPAVRMSDAIGVPRTRGWAVAATAVVALLVAIALPAQWIALTHRSLNLAREEAPALSAVFHPGQSRSDDDLLTVFRNEKQVAADLGAMHLPVGAVLTDSAFAFPIIINISDPRVFVINSDLDFADALKDPRGHHIRYLLVRTGAPSDELLKRWPTLTTTGAGVASVIRQWQGPLSHWRLFQLS